MDKIDQLLAQLDQHGNAVPQPAPSGKASASTQPRISIDRLLGEITEEAKRSVRSELSHRAELGHSPALSSLPSPPLPTQVTSPTVVPDPLLTQLKTQYSEQDRLEGERQAQAQREAEQQRQRQEQEKQRRLQALQAQRRAELTEVAQQWLKQLKPKSEEGRWFAEFACNYESRLEAAIDYLEALEQVDRNLI